MLRPLEELFARGGDIGLDLTRYKLSNVPNMPLGIVDPSFANLASPTDAKAATSAE